MGCSSCGSGSDGLPGGCKNNGVCGTYGCNKLDVFDWLAGMDLPINQKAFDVVEVRFKNSRKSFFRNSTNLELLVGDVVAVEASPGHDIGIVSLTGELVRIQLKRRDIKDNYEVKKLYRKAKQDDIERWQEGRKREQETMMAARDIARALKLDMKISDIEYQGDLTRATFYYTADDRVDFRELIKQFAEKFKVRIEMRQIGYRAEAGRLGGIGSCGRELCCSTWLTDFRAVSTSAARYQQLSLNPSKLAGQCGKLKCCLNYELDQYLEAFKELPPTTTRLQLPNGVASHFKTDVFRRLMYYSVDGPDHDAPLALSIDAVKEIIEMNKKGIKPEDVRVYQDVKSGVEEDVAYGNVVGQDSLTRFDRSRKNQKHSGRRDNNPAKRKGAEGASTRPAGNRPEKSQKSQSSGNPSQNNSGPNSPGRSGNHQRPNRNSRGPSKPRPEQGRPSGDNNPLPPKSDK